MPEMKIPEMIINIMYEGIMLPFFIIGAPNIRNSEYLHWLFSGRSRQTITCTGPITHDQFNFFRSMMMTGEIIYKKRKHKFTSGCLTDVLERDTVPFSINNIRPIFHRSYDEYMIFYFQLVEGLGNGII